MENSEPREKCRNLIEARFRHILSELLPGEEASEINKSVTWFTDTMMYLIDLHVAEWKLPTYSEMLETSRQMNADIILAELSDEEIV